MILYDAECEVETVNTLSDGSLIWRSGKRMRNQTKIFFLVQPSTKRVATLAKPPTHFLEETVLESSLFQNAKIIKAAGVAPWWHLVAGKTIEMQRV